MVIEFKPSVGVDDHEAVRVSHGTPAKVGQFIVSVSPGGPDVWVSTGLPMKGRPSTGKAKKAVTIRLDQDVVSALEAREDWRVEVNAVLRRHLGL